MEHSSSQTSIPRILSPGAVVGITESLDNARELLITCHPDGVRNLTRIGITDIVIPVDSGLAPGLTGTESAHIHKATRADIAPARQIFSLDEPLAQHDVSTEGIWSTFESGVTCTSLRSETLPRFPLGLMLQMSVPLLPIVEISDYLIPSRTAYRSGHARDHRELLRSLIFWRQKFGIVGLPLKLVYADDGFLFFKVGTWLVILNFNELDASLDMENQGEMWLMLGTEHAVHYHGFTLHLPPRSGAILATEALR